MGKNFKSFLNCDFPSCFWCMLMIASFSFYTYKNIFLQAEIGFKLPTVNLVSALNNFDVFVAVPSTERFDLYINLAKTFDAYKTDYLQHYNDYLLMLNTYLVLDESQIGFKYYAYKHYLNQNYKEYDGFVLGSPIIEFNQNFYTSEANSTDREINLVNKHYHVFGLKNNMPECERFFNNYIYPLYKSQSSWKEVEIATSMSKILKHWTMINSLQIGIFFCSLILNLVALSVLVISRADPKVMLKPYNAKTFTLLFFLNYVAVLILILISLFVKIITYNANMNFEGLHNVGFLLLELVWISIIGYFVFCWIAKFKQANHVENQSLEKEDSLQIHLTELFETKSVESNISNEKHDYLSTEKLTGVIGPFIQKVKRIITPVASHAVTASKEEEGVSSAKTIKSIDSTNSLVETIDTQKLFSKDPFDGLKALNMVSALSTSHPNVSPYSQIDKNLDYTSSITTEKKSKTDSSSAALTIQRSKLGSISQSLEDKRNGFYQHCGTTVQLNNETSPSIGNLKDLQEPDHINLTYSKSLNNNPLSLSKDNLNSDNDFEWETKFGLKSSQSVSNGSNGKVREGDETTEKYQKLQSCTKEKYTTTKHTSKEQAIPPEPRKSYQYLIPSTSITSGVTVDSDFSDEESSRSNEKGTTAREHRKSI